MTLTKADMIEMLSEEVGFSQKKAREIVEALIEIIKSQMESGDDVLIGNLGKFCIREKKACRGRNPATGGDLILEPRRIVSFKCSGNLRRKIQDGKER